MAARSCSSAAPRSRFTPCARRVSSLRFARCSERLARAALALGTGALVAVLGGVDDVSTFRGHVRDGEAGAVARRLPRYLRHARCAPGAGRVRRGGAPVAGGAGPQKWSWPGAAAAPGACALVPTTDGSSSSSTAAGDSVRENADSVYHAQRPGRNTSRWRGSAAFGPAHAASNGSALRTRMATACEPVYHASQRD
jgi:hypothetical protein